MEQSKVPWNLRDVLAVHFMRLLMGFVTVRFIYPLFFSAPPPVVEVTDRLIVVGLVWYVLRRHGIALGSRIFPAQNQLRSVAVGVAAGALLLGVSVFSERLYTAVFLLSPTQHPIVALVETARSWQELLLPLFLAGLAAPVAEEMLYRLFTFSALKERFGLWGGAVASAAIFALFHFNPFWLAEMMVVGTGLALLYYWSGSLISAIVAHSFVNTSKVVLLYLNIPLV